MKRRVVITGLGAVSALGEGALPLWEAALAGRSGIGVLDFGQSGSPDWHPAGARFDDFNPEKYIAQRKSLKVMARDIQLAVAGAGLALSDAGIPSAAIDRTRAGVVIGAGVLNHELDELAPSLHCSMTAASELDLKKFGESGIPSLFPLWLLKYLPNMPACHVSVLFDFQGINNTVTTGASAGLQAVGEAFRIIGRGDADLLLAGGAESRINPMGLSRYKLLGFLAKEDGADPKKIYRPFDEKAGGFVVGEGAGFLVLEDLGHAKKRNAKIYAEVAGLGFSDENGHEIAMETAMKEASLKPDDISYMQASGLGIKKEDDREAQAVEKVFGHRTDPLCVTGSKPVLGFSGFAAGAIDAVLSTLALTHETIPPLLNFSKAAKDRRFEIIQGGPVNKKMNCAMTGAFGLGGPATAIITKLYRGD